MRVWLPSALEVDRRPEERFGLRSNGLRRLTL